jgi:hypothetical protein
MGDVMARFAVAEYRNRCSLFALHLHNISLSGCAGMLNPYVRHDPAKHPFARGRVTLFEAICYADDVRARYRDALANQDSLSTGLGAALIPLTGIIGYQGISGVNGHAIAATSLAGAAALGTGTYLHSAPRQMVYAESSAAITCAIGLVAPLQLGEGEAKGLDATVDRMLPGMLQAISGMQGAPARRLAQQIKKTVDAVRRARAALDGAAIQLVFTVDGIIDQADRRILSTVPDPQAMAAKMGGLLPLPKIGPEDLPTIGDAAALRMKKPGGLETMQESVEDMLARSGYSVNQALDTVAFVAAIVERMHGAPAATAVAACGEQFAAGITSIRLHPEPAGDAIILAAERRSEYRAACRRTADSGSPVAGRRIPAMRRLRRQGAGRHLSPGIARRDQYQYQGTDDQGEEMKRTGPAAT